MRIILNIFVVGLLTIVSPIFCSEIKKNTTTYNIGLSLGLASGGSIGIGKIQYFERSTKEITYNCHYLQNSDYYVTGVYCQINHFRNRQRKGFFTLLVAGIDYTKGEYLPISFGGTNGTEKYKRIIPNIALGCGYSIKLSPYNRMLIYLDLGLKKTISNLNLTISF